MDDGARMAPESENRRKLLCAGAGSLFLSLGSSRYACAQGSGATERLASQFQHDFTKYGYQSYMAEIAERIDKGAVQGGGRKLPAAGADRTAEFRRAWGIEERYEVDWGSLSLMPYKSRVDGHRITRMRFRLDCGFPVVALMGGQGRKGTVLLLHGMGATPERSMGLESPDYMRHIGRRLMHLGYTVVCPFFPHAGNFVSVAQLGLHLAAQGIAFHNVAVMSVLASLDVALRRAGGTAGRAYCYGVSMGALIGLHASLMDRRVKGLILSGYVREDESLLSQGVYDAMLKQGEIYPALFSPGAWRYGFEKTLKLWMPKPLFIEVGLGDAMSGVAQGRDRALKRIQDAYAANGGGETLDSRDSLVAMRHMAMLP